jgi:hypothetical protein
MKITAGSGKNCRRRMSAAGSTMPAVKSGNVVICMRSRRQKKNPRLLKGGLQQSAIAGVAFRPAAAFQQPYSSAEEKSLCVLVR